MRPASFARGTSIALREIWHGRIWSARPAIVVEDAPERTILHVEPGARWKLPVDPATGDQMRYPERPWSLADRVWRANRVLSFAWPRVSYAVLLFWSTEGTFRGWYVNLQTPLLRTGLGFDYMDDMLDVVVAPDRSWHRKDEAELARCVELGLWSPERAEAIRAEVPRVAERIERREEPFGERWLDWEPNPSWDVPELPVGWQDLPAVDPG